MVPSVCKCPQSPEVPKIAFGTCRIQPSVVRPFSDMLYYLSILKPCEIVYGSLSFYLLILICTNGIVHWWTVIKICYCYLLLFVIFIKISSWFKLTILGR